MFPAGKMTRGAKGKAMSVFPPGRKPAMAWRFRHSSCRRRLLEATHRERQLDLQRRQLQCLLEVNGSRRLEPWHKLPKCKNLLRPASQIPLDFTAETVFANLSFPPYEAIRCPVCQTGVLPKAEQVSKLELDIYLDALSEAAHYNRSCPLCQCYVSPLTLTRLLLRQDQLCLGDGADLAGAGEPLHREAGVSRGGSSRRTSTRGSSPPSQATQLPKLTKEKGDLRGLLKVQHLCAGKSALVPLRSKVSLLPGPPEPSEESSEEELRLPLIVTRILPPPDTSRKKSEPLPALTSSGESIFAGSHLRPSASLWDMQLSRLKRKTRRSMDTLALEVMSWEDLKMLDDTLAVMADDAAMDAVQGFGAVSVSDLLSRISMWYSPGGLSRRQVRRCFSEKSALPYQPDFLGRTRKRRRQVYELRKTRSDTGVRPGLPHLLDEGWESVYASSVSVFARSPRAGERLRTKIPGKGLPEIRSPSKKKSVRFLPGEESQDLLVRDTTAAQGESPTAPPSPPPPSASTSLTAMSTRPATRPRNPRVVAAWKGVVRRAVVHNFMIKTIKAATANILPGLDSCLEKLIQPLNAELWAAMDEAVNKEERLAELMNKLLTKALHFFVLGSEPPETEPTGERRASTRVNIMFNSATVGRKVSRMKNRKTLLAASRWKAGADSTADKRTSAQRKHLLSLQVRKLASSPTDRSMPEGKLDLSTYRKRQPSRPSSKPVSPDQMQQFSLKGKKLDLSADRTGQFSLQAKKLYWSLYCKQLLGMQAAKFALSADRKRQLGLQYGKLDSSKDRMRETRLQDRKGRWPDYRKQPISLQASQLDLAIDRKLQFGLQGSDWFIARSIGRQGSGLDWSTERMRRLSQQGSEFDWSTDRMRRLSRQGSEFDWLAARTSRQDRAPDRLTPVQLKSEKGSTEAKAPQMPISWGAVLKDALTTEVQKAFKKQVFFTQCLLGGLQSKSAEEATAKDVKTSQSAELETLTVRRSSSGASTKKAYFVEEELAVDGGTGLGEGYSVEVAEGWSLLRKGFGTAFKPSSRSLVSQPDMEQSSSAELTESSSTEMAVSSSSEMEQTSSSEMLGGSETEMVKPSKSKLLESDETEKVKPSRTQLLGMFGTEKMKPSKTQLLGMFGMEKMKPSKTQIFGMFGTEKVRPSKTRTWGSFGTDMMKPSRIEVVKSDTLEQEESMEKPGATGTGIQGSELLRSRSSLEDSRSFSAEKGRKARRTPIDALRLDLVKRGIGRALVTKPAPTTPSTPSTTSSSTSSTTSKERKTQFEQLEERFVYDFTGVMDNLPEEPRGPRGSLSDGELLDEESSEFESSSTEAGSESKSERHKLASEERAKIVSELVLPERVRRSLEMSERKKEAVAKPVEEAETKVGDVDESVTAKSQTEVGTERLVAAKPHDDISTISVTVVRSRAITRRGPRRLSRQAETGKPTRLQEPEKKPSGITKSIRSISSVISAATVTTPTAAAKATEAKPGDAGRPIRIKRRKESYPREEATAVPKVIQPEERAEMEAAGIAEPAATVPPAVPPTQGEPPPPPDEEEGGLKSQTSLAESLLSQDRRRRGRLQRREPGDLRGRSTTDATAQELPEAVSPKAGRAGGKRQRRSKTLDEGKDLSIAVQRIQPAGPMETEVPLIEKEQEAKQEQLEREEEKVETQSKTDAAEAEKTTSRPRRAKAAPSDRKREKEKSSTTELASERSWVPDTMTEEDRPDESVSAVGCTVPMLPLLEDIPSQSVWRRAKTAMNIFPLSGRIKGARRAALIKLMTLSKFSVAFRNRRDVVQRRSTLAESSSQSPPPEDDMIPKTTMSIDFGTMEELRELEDETNPKDSDEELRDIQEEKKEEEQKREGSKTTISGSDISRETKSIHSQPFEHDSALFAAEQPSESEKDQVRSISTVSDQEGLSSVLSYKEGLSSVVSYKEGVSLVSSIVCVKSARALAREARRAKRRDRKIFRQARAYRLTPNYSWPRHIYSKYLVGTPIELPKKRRKKTPRLSHQILPARFIVELKLRRKITVTKEEVMQMLQALRLAPKKAVLERKKCGHLNKMEFPYYYTKKDKVPEHGDDETCLDMMFKTLQPRPEHREEGNEREEEGGFKATASIDKDVNVNCPQSKVAARTAAPSQPDTRGKEGTGTIVRGDFSNNSARLTDVESSSSTPMGCSRPASAVLDTNTPTGVSTPCGFSSWTQCPAFRSLWEAVREQNVDDRGQRKPEEQVSTLNLSSEQAALVSGGRRTPRRKTPIKISNPSSSHRIALPQLCPKDVQMTGISPTPSFGRRSHVKKPVSSKKTGVTRPLDGLTSPSMDTQSKKGKSKPISNSSKSLDTALTRGEIRNVDTHLHHKSGSNERPRHFSSENFRSQSTAEALFSDSIDPVNRDSSLYWLYAGDINLSWTPTKSSSTAEKHESSLPSLIQKPAGDPPVSKTSGQEICKERISSLKKVSSHGSSGGPSPCLPVAATGSLKPLEKTPTTRFRRGLWAERAAKEFTEKPTGTDGTLFRTSFQLAAPAPDIKHLPSPPGSRESSKNLVPSGNRESSKNLGKLLLPLPRIGEKRCQFTENANIRATSGKKLPPGEIKGSGCSSVRMPALTIERRAGVQERKVPPTEKLHLQPGPASSAMRSSVARSHLMPALTRERRACVQERKVRPTEKPQLPPGPASSASRSSLSRSHLIPRGAVWRGKVVGQKKCWQSLPRLT